MTGLSGRLWKASLKLTSGTYIGSSKKKLSSGSSSSTSTGGSLLMRVDSDCILRTFQAMRVSFPATIMSNLSPATFASYILANSDRSTSQGSIPFSSTRLNTARIDSSTGSWSLSPVSARERMSMYPPILLSDSSSSASALWNSRCCSRSSILVFPSIISHPASCRPPRPRSGRPRPGPAALLPCSRRWAAW